MLLAVHISSYGCTWDVWRALKKLELHSAIASCNPYASFVLSKLPASIHNSILRTLSMNKFLNHVVHLLFFFSLLFCRNEKGLLNFVCEKIIFLNLVYGINNTRYCFQKSKLPFKLVKPRFIGRLLSNESPYLNINYCLTGRALKIYDQNTLP